MKLDNPRVVIITGASNGIGAALARAYAAPGVVLGLVGRHEGRLNEVADACRAAGARPEVLVADVTDCGIGDVLRRFDAAHPIDLLIASAGVTSGIPAPGTMEPWETAEKAAETNFMGALRTIAPVAEMMAARGRGQIAGIGSLAALTPLPSSPAYSAAKAGLETYILALRRLLGPRGVSLNVVSLGYVETDMSRKLAGHKPFLIGPDVAARKIRDGLVKNKPRLSYPVVLSIGIRLLNLLPERLALLILPAFAFTISS